VANSWIFLVLGRGGPYFPHQPVTFKTGIRAQRVRLKSIASENTIAMTAAAAIRKINLKKCHLLGSVLNKVV
jgi:hypothetical protein